LLDIERDKTVQIKNRIFYHIHRFGPHSSIWKVGNRINWVRKNKNIFNSFFDTYRFMTDNTNGNGSKHLLAAIECFRQQAIDFKQAQINDYLEMAYTVIKEQGMFIRETIFEEVRSSYFPHLPSRKTCIWVFEKEAIEYWWDSLEAQQKFILELQLTGSMHHADQKYLVNDTLDHDTLRSLAFEYWTGTEGNKSIEEEILFEGVIDVKRSFENVDEFKKVI